LVFPLTADVVLAPRVLINSSSLSRAILSNYPDTTIVNPDNGIPSIGYDGASETDN